MAALFRLSHSIHQMLFLPFWGHSQLVRSGEFDRILARPVHPILHILTSSPDLGAVVGEMLPAVVLLSPTCSEVKVAWNLPNILSLLLVLVSGAVIEWADFLFFAALDFWFVQADSLKWLCMPFHLASRYGPVHAYGRGLSVVLTFVLPYAFLAYYPTHHLFLWMSRPIPLLFPV